MRIFALVFALVYSAFAVANPTIVFERSGSIWSAEIDGSKMRKIAKGNHPDISPNGKLVAYDIDYDEKDKTLIRQLRILNLDLGTITQLKKIPSQNNFAPVWSPDNKKLLFSTNISADHTWRLGLISANDNNYRTIKNSEEKYSPSWNVDGQSFFCRGMNSIYWMDLQGKLIKKWRMDKIIANSQLGSVIQVSPDGKNLIMDMDMNEAPPANISDWHGSLSALWIFNLESNKAQRLTPKGMLAWSPAWIDNDTFVFLSKNAAEKYPVLRKGSLKKVTNKLLIKDVQHASVSR